MRTFLVPAPVGRRSAQLVVGLVLYTLSMALLVHADLGNMPWDVLSQGIARRTGASFGTVTLAISVLVLVCWIPLRQRPGVGTVANVLVIGFLVDPLLDLLDLLPDLPWAARAAMAGLGIVMNAVATGLYVGAQLGPGPRDGLMTGLVRRTGRPVAVVRTTIEVLVVSVGWALGGRLGIATVVYAVCVGPLVHLVLPRLTIAVPDAAPARASGRVSAGASSSPSPAGR
ncbi:hypothetical protein IC607_06165 [Cellulomonas sp. JH27-2]|uniref:membrane protein YczE n=1 Tax=Cellulomonas sp. JH27-2 TaxID=2774139 RepID=UPI00177D5D8D|nr:hypothetical protein [Cellulomonas sp. JH27-2]MBD8058548.1 hypothetical protein [Cellulomonas sp. JH27-2]